MKKRKTTFNKWIILIATGLFLPFVSHAQTISFDDSNPDTIFVDNGSVYRLALLKGNGAFAYIRDKAAGVNLVQGDLSCPLWRVVPVNGDTVTSSEFVGLNKNRFNYNWNSEKNILTLNYLPNSGPDVQLRISCTLTVTPDTRLDMQLTILNESGYPINAVDFPHFGLNMKEDTAVIAAEYPGFMLYPKFFTGKVSFKTGYPDAAHADFVSVTIRNSCMNVYTHWHGVKLHHTIYGFYPEVVPSLNHTYHYHHEYQVWIKDDSTWISPVTRLRIGQSTVKALKAYRSENHIEEFPSLQTKLGTRYDLVSKSPLYPYHFGGWMSNLKFKELPAFIAQFPGPAIVMPTQYFTGGVHGLHPDYLPPDPQWGTKEDFIKMVDDIQAQDKLIMPVTLPVWWHENSPTVKSLGASGIVDIARLDQDGKPEYYGMVVNDHWDYGYYVSPFSPFVKQRLNQMFQDIFSTYGADIIYEDVLGCHGGLFDFNAHSPSPNDLLQGWHEYARNYKNYPCMGEKIYDLMSEYLMGSIGVSFASVRSSSEPEKYVRAPYPAAPILYNDKMTTYEWMDASSTRSFSYHILFGVPFTLSMLESSVEGVPKFRDFQDHVMSRIFGKQMVDYTGTPGRITTADYGDIKVTYNCSNNESAAIRGYTLPPYGVLVESDDGNLVAGILSAFNGENLDIGGRDHHLIQMSGTNEITIKHPFGEPTPIKIKRPAAWSNSSLIKVTGYTSAGGHNINFNLDNQSIRFTLDKYISNKDVLSYKITYGATGISEKKNPGLPDRFELFQNHPNPFNGHTAIVYQIPESDHITLKIYNLSGQEVRILLDEVQNKGKYTVDWDGKNNLGRYITPGVYLIKLEAGIHSCIRKMVKLN